MRLLFHLAIAQLGIQRIQLFPEVLLIKSVKIRADVPFLFSDRPLWMSILGR